MKYSIPIHKAAFHMSDEGKVNSENITSYKISGEVNADHCLEYIKFYIFFLIKFALPYIDS